MTHIEDVAGPEDLAGMTEAELVEFATQIRAFLVDRVSRTGGHLGPNLGVVELSVALHRIFHSPTDAILWDTGHQAYVHKILTGRADEFNTLRQPGGLSGYPSRTESDHDVIENSHASTSLSYADGLAKAWERSGELGRRHVVAVIGDGALTGGMAWEALNNIAGAPDRQVIIVVNDNARSYSPTIGGVASHLSTLRTTDGYERFLDWGKRLLAGTPVLGRPAYGTLHGVKKGIKDIVAPQGMFEDLGLKYIGPVDGHSIPDLETALTRARSYHGPVIVHAITEKGRGYAPAEADEADRFHGVGVINPDTGAPVAGSVPTWTAAFGKELVAIGRQRPDVVAITAAMLAPTGLSAFASEFPNRTYDVGIAEQHAAASAAGMAFGGLHPVVALYATFLNRAFDQVLMDCALHKAGVTFVLDRAGVTGDDGASHNGVWDLSMMSFVPGVRVAAPRDAVRLRQQLREAVGVEDGPTVIRYPKGALPKELPALDTFGQLEILSSTGRPQVLLVSVGAMAERSMAAAALLSASGIGVSVVDPGWVLPVSADLISFAASFEAVVTVEDNCRGAGVGAAVALALADAGLATRFEALGVPVAFLSQGRRSDLLDAAGLSAQGIAASAMAVVAGRHPANLLA